MIKENIACRTYFRFKNDFAFSGITSTINNIDGTEMVELDFSMTWPTTDDEINFLKKSVVNKQLSSYVCLRRHLNRTLSYLMSVSKFFGLDCGLVFSLSLKRCEKIPIIFSVMILVIVQSSFHQSPTWWVNELIQLREHMWRIAYRNIANSQKCVLNDHINQYPKENRYPRNKRNPTIFWVRKLDRPWYVILRKHLLQTSLLRFGIRGKISISCL